LKILILILLLLLPAPVSAQLASSLTSFWEMGEVSGTRSDSHGTNHLTDNNTVTQAVGKVGSAAHFTRASSEYLSIADNATLSVGGISFTWAGWVYIDAIAAGDWMNIIGKEGASASVTDYGLRYTTADSINRFTFFIGGSSYSVIQADAFGAASTATWYFIVAWHDTSNNTINIQVNNGTIDSVARSAAPVDGTSALHIGSMGSAGPGRYWDGRIDQFGFWRRTLTSTEKTWLYNGGTGRTYDEVLAEDGGGGPIVGVTALGITQAEIDVWNSRRVSGPYKSAGDVSTNSPGDWDRINSNATTFRSSPTSARWSGQPGGSCWSYLSEPPALPGGGDRTAGDLIRDAAFRYLLMGDTADRDAVLTELLAQAATAGTNWTDSSRWLAADPCFWGDGHSWEISMWMTKLLRAYDYIRHSISGGNATTLDAWFTNYATLLVTNTDFNPSEVFPNRLSDNYDTQNVTTCSGAALTHFGGFTYCGTFHEVWNNRSGSHIRVIGLVGLMTSNATFQSRAERWIKEWVRFSNFSDNTAGETYRWNDVGWVGHAFHYPGMAISTYIEVADAFARAGDTELYDYSTSLGDNSGLTPAGGPKTLFGISSKFLDHVDETLLRYATASGANNGNPDYLIDSVCELCSESYVHDTNFAPGNMYWRNARITSLYTRQAGSTPAYPATVASWGSTCDGFCGSWGALPGVLFMFGQMEDSAANPFLADSGGGGGGARRRLSAVTDLSGKIESASTGTANVSLGWSDPNVAADQSEDGTLVNREIAGTFQQVGSVGPNVTQFFQSFSAAAGSQQCYQVRPVYSDGLLGADPSNEWCATVPPCKQKGKSGNC
jgi:hypothetical protein